MLLALAAAVLPVVIGVGLAMVPGLRMATSGTAHRLVLAMATAVVLLLMLPEAVAEVGWLALAVFGVALVAPAAVERLAGDHHGHSHDHDHDHGHDHPNGARMDAELGFAGMLLHQAVEGAELGAVSATGQPLLAVAGAVALHTVPLVAAVVHGCVLRAGARGGLLRGAALAVTTAVGVPVGAMAATAFEGLEPWVAAAVGGLLLHALWHAWGPDH